jgi:uncharacterized protein (DUF1015 family)
MVDIGPFRALRYDGRQIDDLAAVLAPPYDVISPAEQERLYARHPANIVRVDLTRREPDDDELGPYRRAAETLTEWLSSGVMAADAAPAYYVLAQTFTGPDGVTRTRTGFFGKARLSRFGEGPIMPHERTLTGPKLDRLRLYRTTRTNLSPIFGMFQDPDGEILEHLQRAMQAAPTAEAQMGGVQNKLWRLEDSEAVEALRRALAPKKLYIADGHHRYETGLAYRDERRQAATGAPAGEEPGYESILMFSAAVEDPGMVVFPTHRLVFGLEPFSAGALTERLSRFFDVTPAPEGAEAAVAALARAGERGNAFLLATASGRHLLSAKADAPWDEVAALPEHPALRGLDVAVLHAVVLEHVLGISKEAQASQTNLCYSKDAREALEAPARGFDGRAIQAAFLMNPTKVGEVIAVANAGEVMPQKSTFFYPKIPSGLVLYPLD